MYNATVILDSCDAETGKRIVTLTATFPRSILAEMNTHGRLSRNTASSRVMSVRKLIEQVQTKPYIPEFTRECKGMQGERITDGRTIADMTRAWLDARTAAVSYVGYMSGCGLHKQDVNRLLEPWLWTTQLITATEWMNFFAQRCHHDAHPAMQRIARLMYEAIEASVPTPLNRGEWHLPFVIGKKLDHEYHVRSVARCAWVSYENHMKDGTFDACLSTYDKLLADPVVWHLSPFQHQARNDGPDALPSNLVGWTQLRKLVPGEEIREFRRDW